jgi:hypothetical protein
MKQTQELRKVVRRGSYYWGEAVERKFEHTVEVGEMTVVGENSAVEISVTVARAVVKAR